MTLSKVSKPGDAADLATFDPRPPRQRNRFTATREGPVFFCFDRAAFLVELHCPRGSYRFAT